MKRKKDWGHEKGKQKTKGEEFYEIIEWTKKDIQLRTRELHTYI